MTTDRLQEHPIAETAKALGAYYTDWPSAEFLVRWAVRRPDDHLADPAFGGGVFLAAGSERLKALGGDPAAQVHGVEIEPDVRAHTAAALQAEHGVLPDNLLLNDFFAVDAEQLTVQAMVGNPPFIRYQRFSGAARELALKRAKAEGVPLSRLASSWAPFLVHASSLVAAGGRLGMVVPFEVGHAAYALPVLDYLHFSYASVTFLTFKARLFPQLSQDALLLLADGKGQGPATFRWQDIASSGDLATLDPALPDAVALDAERLARGDQRLVEAFMPPAARMLYAQLAQHRAALRLGKLADVGIGYVTGANDFFHLSPAEAKHKGIKDTFLRAAVRRGRGLKGIKFTSADWAAQLDTGESGYLLALGKGLPLSEGVRRHLAEGEAAGVHLGYKCRVRTPWYVVPHVYLPDAFLTYMSGDTPALVANDAKVIAPNSLHVVRLHAGVDLSADALAALWQTSLTLLSVEIEGHAMGGGLLKLEPTEAERVLVANPPLPRARLDALAEELDVLIRAGHGTDARDRADAVILGEGLGLTEAEWRALRAAAEVLRARRTGR